MAKPDTQAVVVADFVIERADMLKLLGERHVRYAVFHKYWYNDANWHDVTTRLTEFDPYLRRLYADEGTRLYEIVGMPP